MEAVATPTFTEEIVMSDKILGAALGHFSAEMSRLNAGILLLNKQIAAMRLESKLNREPTTEELQAADEQLLDKYAKLVERLTQRSADTIADLLDLDKANH
ncbi:hypothetical protein DA2_3186 [Desulfovibrio sp. A2]|nr:hypothetical protein DA2_3186 [Desulfovibrio sp. A2]